REDIRYAIKKNGYHGGISRQEMIVPLGIWTPPGQTLPEEEYGPAPDLTPAWWEDAGEPAVLLQAVTEQRAPTKKKTAEVSGDLFEAGQESGMAGALIRSSVFAHQQRRVGRVALEPDSVQTLVQALEAGGGRASIEQLARAIGVPVMRMRGVVSILQRTLNIDGYAIVAFEQASNTVLIHLGLLRTQLHL